MCIFCKIETGEINSKKLFESKHFFVIEDINPKKKTHLLIISKKHFADLNEMPINIASDFIDLIQEISRNLEDNHYNLQINTGSKSGQEVFHFHTHFLTTSALKSTAFS